MSDARYQVDLSPAAQRQLKRLPPGDAARLRPPILALAIEPRPPGVAKLVGTEFWRLRVGDLRVVYAIDDTTSLVIVLRVARRAESTYRHLAGSLRSKATRHPEDESWSALHEAAWSTSDPDRDP